MTVSVGSAASPGVASAEAAVPAPRHAIPAPGAAQALADRLDDPQVAAALSTLLDHADLLAVLVSGLSGFVERSETIGDSLIDGIAELREAASENDVLKGLQSGELTDSLMTLSGTLPQLTPVISRLAGAVAEGARKAETDPVQVGGAISVLRLLKDPDINRAASFVATVAKELGKELRSK